MALERASELDNQRRVEKLFDPLKFDALLTLAETMCLSQPSKPDSLAGPLKGERALIAEIGITGLRAALDFTIGQERMPDDDTPDRSLVPSPDLPIRHPMSFGGGLDYERSMRTEAFGAQLMAESVRVLGPDAQKMIVKYREARNDNEQIDVLDWLEYRLQRMTKNPESHDEIYHPIRLSPKALGEFPDMNLTPTCLAVSVIAAGFLREAGADFMHAGVAVTGRQQMLWEAALQCASFDSYAEMFYGIDIPQELDERTGKRFFDLLGRYTRDDGSHASLMVRLQSDTWYQFDSNYGTSLRVPDVQPDDSYNQSLNDSYETLSSLRDVAPGLETYVTPGIESIVNMTLDVYLRSDDSALIAMDRVRKLLKDDDRESILERLKHQVLVPFIDYETDSHYVQTLQRLIKNAASPNYDNDYELLDNAYYDAVQKWLLNGEDLFDVLDRCRRDESYLERKLDDVQLLGLLTVQLFASQLYALRYSTIEAGGLHHVIEVGLPESRIGHAVLSDISTYCDDRLSIHHWLAQWSSVLPITGKIPIAARSDAQTEVLSNAATVLDGKRFTYAHNSGKTKKYLDARQTNGAEDER